MYKASKRSLVQVVECTEQAVFTPPPFSLSDEVEVNLDEMAEVDFVAAAISHDVVGEWLLRLAKGK